MVAGSSTHSSRLDGIEITATNRVMPSPVAKLFVARCDLSLDEAERARRTAVVEEALEAHREHGYRIDARCTKLCEAYVEGSIDMEQLRAAIMRPHLN